MRMQPLPVLRELYEISRFLLILTHSVRKRLCSRVVLLFSFQSAVMSKQGSLSTWPTGKDENQDLTALVLVLTSTKGGVNELFLLHSLSWCSDSSVIKVSRRPALRFLAVVSIVFVRGRMMLSPSNIQWAHGTRTHYVIRQIEDIHCAWIIITTTAKYLTGIPLIMPECRDPFKSSSSLSTHVLPFKFSPRFHIKAQLANLVETIPDAYVLRNAPLPPSSLLPLHLLRGKHTRKAPQPIICDRRYSQTA